MTATTWDFDLSHSSVNFSVRHLMVSKVHGRFQSWGGTLVIDNDDITRSRVNVEIDASSIDTKEEKRDAHLRSADFFDVENHPKLVFKSTSVKKVSDDELEVTGDLTIRGTTKPIVLKVESNGTVKDPWGCTRTGFSGKATIHRKEFGLHWNALLETGGVVVGDKVSLGIEVELVRAVAAAAA